MNTIPTLQAIQQASLRIQPYIHQTPVLTSKSIDELVGANVFFKCENFQKTGSFKMRGASNVIFGLSAADMQYGVATQSSGNHGQAVALAAHLRNIPAYIVMPTNTAQVKIASVKAYGGTIRLCEPTIEAREKALQEVLVETNAHYVHAYNDYRVIAGQGTLALDFLAQIPQIDILLCPVGGGGLISGTVLAATYVSPTTTVIGVEPAEADDAFRSFYSGVMQTNTTTNTIADGLRGVVRDKTFGIMRNHLSQLIRVEEHEIIAAMKLLWNRLKIIIEPSSAVPFAALLSKKIENTTGKRIGILLTGGNVDVETLPF